MANWKDGINLLSLFASILGLVWLALPNASTKGASTKTASTKTASNYRHDELEATENTLFRMIFSYWAVHCLALGILRLWVPSGEIVVLSLKFTAILTYFLTAACVLSLPLSRFASTQQVEE